MHIDCLLDSILIILSFLRVVIVFWISRRIDWLLGYIAKILRGEKERWGEVIKWAKWQQMVNLVQSRL